MNENPITRKERIYDFCRSKNSKWIILGIPIIAIVMMIISLICNIPVLVIIAFVGYFLFWMAESIMLAIIRLNKETYMKNKFLHIVLASFSSMYLLIYSFGYLAYLIITRIFVINEINKVFFLLLLIVGSMWLANNLSKYFAKRIQKY